MTTESVCAGAVKQQALISPLLLGELGMGQRKDSAEALDHPLRCVCTRLWAPVQSLSVCMRSCLHGCYACSMATLTVSANLMSSRGLFYRHTSTCMLKLRDGLRRAPDMHGA